jgi:single-strand DNA-binding protein
MLNKVLLIGNLGRDPEIRHFEGGSMVCKFPVATNENFQDKGGEWQTRTEWHDIVCWGRLAERAEKTLQKGNLIYVEGRISKRKWQDRDGNDRYTTEVVSNTFKLLEKRESGGPRTFEQDFPSIEDQFQKANEPVKSAPEDMSTPEADDLPF